jgi:EAL domain-containing protein (putative c-di-GMP-specific phosphodiesterase class I)
MSSAHRRQPRQAASRDLTVTSSEGVETTREMAVVTSLGVDHAQGFLLSRPLTAAQLQDYAADGAINLP